MYCIMYFCLRPMTSAGEKILYTRRATLDAFIIAKQKLKKIGSCHNFFLRHALSKIHNALSKNLIEIIFLVKFVV
jgi:hypothetical protein